MTEVQFTEEQTGSERPAEETTNTGTETERPEWLPENFEKPEDLANSYKEAQAELTRLKQQAAEQGTEETSEEGDQQDEETGEETSEQEEEGNEDGPDQLTAEELTKFQQEWDENGALSDESREDIKSRFNVDDSAIDAYIEGQKALAEKFEAQVANAFGGQEMQDEVLQWAGQNLSDEQLETYNKQFSSGDANTVLFAADALRNQYERENGRVPNERLEGNTNNAGPNSDSYESWAQVQADMAKPEYKNDPAFRNRVRDKMGRSPNL